MSLPSKCPTISARRRLREPSIGSELSRLGLPVGARPATPLASRIADAITLLPDLAINGGILQGSSVAIRPLAGASNDRQIGLAWRKQSARSEAFVQIGHLLRDWAAANVKAFKER